MTTQSSPIAPVITPPWQERQLSYGLKLLITLAFLLLSVFAITSGITLILVLVSSATSGMRLTGNFWTDYFPLLLALAVFVISLYGAIRLYPLVAAPTRFKPSYGQLDPNFMGQPFEVRFQQPILARAFRGKGTLRFESNQMVFDGTLAPSALFQLGVVVVFTIVPLLVFRVGLGLLPALLIAYLLGKKKLSRVVPYADVRELTVKGCHVTFSCQGEKPNKIAFATSQMDGERLYREMAQRFPAALGGWTG